jgi:hypothetical protein
MEMREGRGVIVFCQMDVTGRTQGDPAADRLARNLLQYVDQFKPAPTRKAVYVGEAAGKAYLEKVGIATNAYHDDVKLAADDVLIVGPGGGQTLTSSQAAIADFIKAGGHVVAIGLDEADAAFPPLKVTTRTAEYITTTFEPPSTRSPLAGVGPADLDNRDPRNLPLIRAGGKVIGNGILCEGENTNVVFCQLVPWQFDYERQYNLKRTYRRASFAVVRILANAGLGGRTPVLSRFGSPVAAGKEEARWRDGLYVDRPEEWDDPYRFFCW